MEILKRIYSSLTAYTLFNVLFNKLHLFELFNAIKFHRISKRGNYYGIDEFYKNIMCFKNQYEKVYILLKGAAGDLSLYYLLLKHIFFYLKDKNISIYIICDLKYKDISGLITRKFPYLSFVYVNDLNYIEYKTVKEIKQFLNLGSNIDIIDLRNLCYCCINEFVKTKGNGHYDSVLKINKKIKKDFFIKDVDEEKNEYHFDNVNYDKISYLMNNFSNGKNKLIICNMENKSLKGTKRDKIPFNQYLDEFREISKDKNIKIIMNSVYDKNGDYEDGNIIITRLNFQEIIYLCEHNYINMFISERNGLNDVFKIFYPEIKQIIYYPDSYIICSKKIYHMLFHSELKNMDIKEFWHIPGNNIIENIRGNFFDTIENNIKKFKIIY